jgi:hypothetical protein
MDLDERLEAMSRDIELLLGTQASNERRFEQVTQNFEVVLDSIKRLERIAVAHEDRLDNLEGQ